MDFFSVCQKSCEGDYVVTSDAVFYTTKSAGVASDIAADGAEVCRGRIGRIEEVCFFGCSIDIACDSTGTDVGIALLRINGYCIEGSQIEDPAIFDSRCRTCERGARATSGYGDFVLVGDFEYFADLVFFCDFNDSTGKKRHFHAVEGVFEESIGFGRDLGREYFLERF